MTNIQREAVNLNVQNRNIVVGLTAVEVNPFGFRFTKGILLRVPGTLDPVPNTTTIWVGNANVTAGTNIETGGFPLVPGSSLYLPVEFVQGLYAISDAADQKLAWLGV
jgi:hypothetical protein